MAAKGNEGANVTSGFSYLSQPSVYKAELSKSLGSQT